MAERLTVNGATPDAQTEAAFQLVFQRGARPEERAQFAAYIERHGLANACQLLLNSNEFLYLD